MKTIEQWNADKAAAYKRPEFEPLTIPKPEPIGAACPCGAELHTDPGTFYGFKPAFGGIVCIKCGRKGYIEDWMCASKIVLVEPRKET